MSIYRKVFVEVMNDGEWISLNPVFLNNFGYEQLRGVYFCVGGSLNGVIWGENGDVVEGLNKLDYYFLYSLHGIYFDSDTNTDEINALNLSKEIKEKIWDEETKHCYFLTMTVSTLQDCRDCITENGEIDTECRALPVVFDEDVRNAQALYDEVCNRVETFKKTMGIDCLPEERVRVVTIVS